MLNKSAFLSIVESAIHRAQDCLINLGHGFEVCLLVSELGVAGFRKYGLGEGGFYIDCNHDDYHLYGFRILFTEARTIPSLISPSDGVIEPVIICNSYNFPDNAPVGSYIYYNGRMVQVVDVGYDKYGCTSFGIKDVRICLIGHMPDDYIEYDVDPLVIAMKKIRIRNEDRDRWAMEPDTSAISDYLDQLLVIGV